LLLFTALLIFTVAGALWPRVGASRLLMEVAALMLLLFCWMPVSMLIVRTVQSPYSWQPPTDKQAGAIVVLAGAIHDPFPPLPLPLLGSSTYAAAATLPGCITNGNPCLWCSQEVLCTAIRGGRMRMSCEIFCFVMAFPNRS
jgi:hypothetical protein